MYTHIHTYILIPYVHTYILNIHISHVHIYLYIIYTYIMHTKIYHVYIYHVYIEHIHTKYHTYTYKIFTLKCFVDIRTGCALPPRGCLQQFNTAILITAFKVITESILDSPSWKLLTFPLHLPVALVSCPTAQAHIAERGREREEKKERQTRTPWKETNKLY